MTREEAVRYFKRHIDLYCVEGICREAEEMAIEALKLEPKTGHWCDEFGGCECSECGCLEAGHSDYCPNCGAKMMEVKE